ncbi:helix-turn-helix domain-containing protein [Metaclostridioides mangenotii]|uniref:helix-turn-helix domain-containing protein n=1 Tax=Metaclostridioides mangenotii TaxID=1540 RepID=UPI001FA6D765|nr:helix-turn-helix transcriptional regulator [Clostridioides mangenotii]
MGEKIRKERLQKQIKQIELAKKVGISNTFLSDIEKGRGRPSIDTLKKIAEALEINCSELID